MEDKKYLSTLEAARVVSPDSNENSARSIISNLVRSGFIERQYPQLAIVEDGKVVQYIDNLVPFFSAAQVNRYMDKIKQQNLKKYRAAGIKIKAENEEVVHHFDNLLDAAFILGGTYRDLRYAVLRGTKFMGYKITRVE